MGWHQQFRRLRNRRRRYRRGRHSRGRQGRTHQPRRRAGATQPPHPATPGNLIEQQGGGHRSVETRRGPPQGDAHQLVAVTTGQHRQAIAFRTGDDHQGAIQIRLLQADVAFLRQADHPIPLLLQGFQRAVEVHHPGHGQMLQRPRCHLGDRTGEACIAALGQHHAVGSERFGAAHNRAEVLGIGEAIDGQQQRGFTDLAAAVHQRGQIEGFRRCRLQHDSLVHGTTADLAQARPGDLLDQDSRGFGVPQQLQEAGAEAHLRCAPDAVDRSTALEGGLGGMAAPDHVVGSGRRKGVCLQRRASGVAGLIAIRMERRSAEISAGLAATGRAEQPRPASRYPTPDGTGAAIPIGRAAFSRAPIGRAPITEPALTGATLRRTTVAGTTIRGSSIGGGAVAEATVFSTAGQGGATGGTLKARRSAGGFAATTLKARRAAS